MHSRCDAADSLMDWIDYYGVVRKKIFIERALELIGGKFIETCRFLVRTFPPPIHRGQPLLKRTGEVQHFTGGDDQDLGVEVQAEVPQQGAGPPGDSQRKYTSLLIEANGRHLVMMQTGKVYHKSIFAVWLQPVGDGSGKWRPEGIAPNPIRKQQVLCYFDFVDDPLPTGIESQVFPGPPPIGVGPSA
uniref:Uncharacterized protein n=1 Tax=Chromera velia CCMP2878 TaxID=1169474 RepID=A0A0G4FMX4_9ALVE|eukprot:Cvel_17865.t1-p1 / transcript=Cvel_17865.t1 / gene=Cvel_17865 / organism=Chromera_velia_CCMP2878 / gene_product=hypothetical protein / transcript_product=hypothetical protein / location=Cvel_scaffold1449:5484-6624(+) / protein_length=187 / sequence_SO=supercontig / SO=protein_coding / is_pseudo=false